MADYTPPTAITYIPAVTVSAKGIANGLSTVFNDGADYGPDTAGTITSGIQEAVNYIVAQGGGRIVLRMGKYTITEAPSTYAYNSGGNSRIIDLPVRTSSDPIAIFIEGEAHALASKDLYIDATGLAAFGTSGACFVFAPANDSSGLYLSVKNIGMQVPQNVGGIRNTTSWGGQYVNLDVQSSVFPSNDNTFGFMLDDSIIDNLYASGMWTGFYYEHSFFNAGLIFATDCYYGLWLDYNADINAVGGHIKFLSVAACTYGILASGSGNALSGGHAEIDYYSMYIQSSSLAPTFVADVWDQQSGGQASTIRIGAASVINSTGSSYVWKLPTVKSGTTAPGLYIDAIHSANGLMNQRFVGGIVSPQGFSATTPAVPASGTAQENTNPYPVRVYLLTGGTGTAFTITDPSGTAKTITATLAAGMEWTLDPGASITLTYTTAPTWVWYGV